MNETKTNAISLPIVKTGDLPLPKYETAGASGLDLRANLPQELNEMNVGLVLSPHCNMLVPTGISIALPEGYEAQVRPRSGLAAKWSVMACLGTIDSDYRGEIKVNLFNYGDQDFVIQHGDRIAQLVIAPVAKAELIEVVALDDTERGAGGFGHTGEK